MVENGRKSNKMKTMNENIAGACVCSMHREFNSLYNLQFYRIRTFFCVDSRKRIKTLVWTRIDRCVFDDEENAFFWKNISVDRVLLQFSVGCRQLLYL